MKILRVDEKEAESIFQNLSQRYKIIAPAEKPGKGRFSNTNLITYDEVKSFKEIEFFKKTQFSAKSALFPIRQIMFEFQGSRINETKEESKPAIIFLRACDINAIFVTDNYFLRDAGYEDLYYQRRRQLIKFFLIECVHPFENCFCVSMGTNKTENYSVFVRKVDRGYEVGVKDEDFKEYFSLDDAFEGGPNFVEKDIAPLSLPEDIDVSIFENDIWEEYSLRCTACGRCNTSCPTCTCFTIQDIPADDKKELWQRTRIWSSCQVKNFALLSGNHDFRIPKGDRMRYKVLHKIGDFKKRVGFNMCVGCGRCDDVCPEYISIFKCVEKINQIIGVEKP